MIMSPKMTNLHCGTKLAALDEMVIFVSATIGDKTGVLIFRGSLTFYDPLHDLYYTSLSLCNVGRED